MNVRITMYPEDPIIRASNEQQRMRATPPVIGIPAVQRGDQVRMMPIREQRNQRMMRRIDERDIRQAERNLERNQREYRQQQERNRAWNSGNMIEYYRLRDENLVENIFEFGQTYENRIERFNQRDEDRVLRRAAIQHLTDLGAHRWQPIVQGVPVESPETVEGTVMTVDEPRTVNPLFNYY